MLTTTNISDNNNVLRSFSDVYAIATTLISCRENGINNHSLLKGGDVMTISSSSTSTMLMDMDEDVDAMKFQEASSCLSDVDSVTTTTDSYMSFSVSDMQDNSCKVCLSSFDDDMPVRCAVSEEHIFCFDCMKRYIELSIRDKQVPIKCPLHGGCGSVVSLNIIRRCIATPLIKRYNSLLMLSQAGASECPKCKAINLDGTKKSPDIICQSCSTVYCFIHSDAHPHRSCGKKHNLKNIGSWVKTRTWKAIRTKHCPGCNVRLEKNGGCPHMKCRCNHEFYWCCRRSFDSNSGHDRTFVLIPFRDKRKDMCCCKWLWAVRVGIITSALPIAAISCVTTGPFLLVYFGVRKLHNKVQDVLKRHK